MTYTAKGPNVLRNEKGSLLEKMYRENYEVESELGDVTDLAGTHRVTLSAFTGTNTAAATAGIDLATGSDISVWGYVLPAAMTCGHMYDYLTEAYKKDTDDAKIEVWADDGVPTKLWTRTLTADGENAKAYHDTAALVATPIAQGTAIYLTAVNTAADSGTGHAIVTVEFIEAP
jgi:hypothetical protein